MTLRWGFKSEANAIAREIRREMGLRPIDPLNPWLLAEYLSIPLLPLSAMAMHSPNAVRHFSHVNQSEFSALTVFDGTKRVIIYNDSHCKGRQASDINHEVSHGLLLHEPKPALDGIGCRFWDKDIEDEANCLSGALLISEEAALYIVRRQLTVLQATSLYGVTEAMLRWRLNATAAYKRVALARRKY